MLPGPRSSAGKNKLRIHPFEFPACEGEEVPNRKGNTFWKGLRKRCSPGQSATVFYCGESVLPPAWRGRGIYRAFFEEREAYARGLGGISWISFCGVVGPKNHPLRPRTGSHSTQYGGTSASRRGPKLLTSSAWKDIDQPA